MSSVWKAVILPKEHGTYSLVIEPVAFALLAAPSRSGALLAVAVLAAGFMRRPIRVLLRDNSEERRSAARPVVIAGMMLAVVALLGAAYSGGVAPFALLIPSALLGLAFLWFDSRGENREAYAEIAGAVALSIAPAGFAAMAGWERGDSLALGAIMLARALPAVVTVRAYLRSNKGEQVSVLPSLLLSAAAVVVAVVLVDRDYAPWCSVVVLLLALFRTTMFLLWPRIRLRATTLGLIESAYGLLFIMWVGLSWSID